MKSLNLCSRLPNLFEITHLQKRKINWTFQEEKEMLTPVNAFICLGALLNTEEDRPGQLDMSSDQDFYLCRFYNGHISLCIWGISPTIFVSLPQQNYFISSFNGGDGDDDSDSDGACFWL